MNKLEKFLFIIYFSLFVCEILSIKSDFFGRIGVYLWFLSWLIIIFYVFNSFIFLLNNRKVLGVILSFSFFVLINTINSVNLSGETTQQIAGTLNYFQTSKDLGFRQTIMFGYPARQFFLPAVISFVFGRSQFLLNFGGSVYYLLGLIIFAKGLLKYFENKENKQLLTVLILAFVPHFYWMNHFIFLYEQSYYPFAFGLMLTGFFLSYLSNFSRKYLFLMALIIYYLIFSYTPSLSLVFFSLITGIYLLIKGKSKENFFIILLIILASAFFLFSSFGFRHDVNLTGEQMSKEYLLKNLKTGLRHLIFLDQGQPMVSSIFQGIFLLTIFLSIFSFKNLEIFTSGLWILATIILSIVSKGYAYYAIDFRLHRASVIFPVLLLIIACFLKNIKFKLNKFYLLLTIIFFLFTGIFFQLNYLNSQEPVRHLIFINFLKEKIKEKKITEREEIIFSDSFNFEYISLNDSLQYFLPNFRYGFISDYLIKGIDDKKAMFALTEDDLYNERLKQMIDQKQKIGIFNFKTDRTLFIFK